MSEINLLYYIYICFGVCGAILGVSYIINLQEPGKEKCSPYECGFEPFFIKRVPFSVRFYFVGILFIIFDLEIAFLFPLGIVSLDLPFIGVLGVYFFLFVLIVGLVYEWAEGGLE